MNTPIVDFVKGYAESNPLRLHMPGHKGVGDFGFEALDITEIDGADVLYDAQGVVKQSQDNATALFGTKSTLYSAEGSSLCIRAMLFLVKSYAVQNGRKAFVAAGRNAHKTFVSACALLDFKVDWLLPENTQTVISCNITADFLESYLCAAKEKPAAIYITSPDYLGNTADIKALSGVCRKHGVLLLVDNAHGAYLKFLSEDRHPVTLGADMCCDSAHKTLPVLTGGAYLHIGGSAPAFFAQNAQGALGLFASTSPSYLILQSLDAANKYLSVGYREKLAKFTERVNKLKSDLSDMGYTLCGDEPLKLTIFAKPYGYTGCELADILRRQNIVCEFCDKDYVVMMFTPEMADAGLVSLKTALSGIIKKTAITALAPVPTLKKQRLSLNATLISPQVRHSVNNCLGRICASCEVACPPAVPIVIMGEEIDVNAIECFKYYGIDTCLVVDDTQAGESLEEEL